jgi:C-terminal processing protease CtpA/Prc
VEEGFNRQESSYLGVRGGVIGMGLQIYDVIPETPAAHAGIQVGDRILGIGEHSLCGLSWVADVLHHYPAGEKLIARVVRKGEWIPENVEITPIGKYLEMGEEDEV